MKISAPWFEYYRKIKTLFSEDKNIKVLYDDMAKEVKIYVEGNRKADAISQLIPEKKVFGNVEVKVTVIPANEGVSKTSSLIKDAFSGNPALADVLEINTPFGEYDYVVFKNKVVQYFNDDLSDLNGVRSTLYQDLAKEVFDNSNAFFCTEAGDNIIKQPLGEWP